ncbi:hypothetical protein HH213_10575 [Duganella dendranthematis]|jgi:hypothetical protein|uniref:Uncharacterized protein n=1 Tax=Duganella dendranthematis TaxID=2728021 RepID=A0ABX6M859_9BURK|nr:hypothetical protein [Duganella dendranthematis]QJD90488.1 hypothetical protein HH213_10575 [Duganella dendranthematis]
MYLLTYLLILLSYPLLFLMITPFILGPVTIYLGFRAWRNKLRSQPGVSGLGKLWAANAMLIATASMIFQIYIINTQYRA